MSRHGSLALVCSVVLASIATVWLWRTGFGPSRKSPPPGAAVNPRLSEEYGKLPLAFYPNAGLTDARVRFMSGGPGYELFLSPSEVSLSLRKASSSRASHPMDQSHADGAAHPTVLRMRWVGANSSANVAGLEELPGKVNFLVGNDPGRWRTGLPTFARIQVADIWPGIDVVYYGNQGCLEYDLVVAPGADPAAIQLAVSGASRVERDLHGDLVLHTDWGEIRQRRPVVYQELKGQRRVVAGEYSVDADGLVSFDVGSYDQSVPLIIDPLLTFSTYLGGNGFDANYAVVDVGGHLYVGGTTNSADFPTEAPNPDSPLQIALGGAPTVNSDAFIAKISPSGSAIVYSTYLGGSGADAPFGIAVDPDGNVVVAGVTQSGDFPTQTPIQAALNGSQDLFVAKLNSTGSGLIYSTVLGGSGTESQFLAATPSAIGALSLGAGGQACVASRTSSTDFPTTSNAFSSTLGGPQDACVAVLDPSGSAMEYGTYFGGGGFDGAEGVHIDAAGDIYLCGATGSVDLPTAPAAPLDNTLNSQDSYVAKLHVTGVATSLVYSTYLGGSGVEFILAAAGPSLAVDLAGRAIVRGGTNSTDFPVASAAQPASGGGVLDAFVAMLDPSGTALVFSTYLGGGGDDAAAGVAVDQAGNVYVSGRTNSGNFPTVDPLPPFPSGGFEAFAAKYSPAGALLFATTFGGSSNEFGAAVAGDDDHIFVVGRTASTNFPLVRPIQGDQFQFDAFITEISFPALGNIAGRVVADCPAPGTPLLGVTVDAFAVGSGSLLGTGVTDANGNYSMLDIPAIDYTVTLVTPLGYSTAASEVPATVSGGQTTVVDFSLNCVSASGNPRTAGYWKHQVGIATGGAGTAQVDATTLCSYLDMIESHFNNNALNQVVVYDAPPSATCPTKLEIAKGLLNLAGSPEMIDRARQQLLALLLNVAANYLTLRDVISQDGATVSQAITFCDNLIDNPAGNHELAKDIADRINGGQQVRAGMIPLGTPVIAYGRRPAEGGEGESGARALEFQVTPNPAASTRTFSFVVERTGPVSLTVFDVAGRRVAEVYSGVLGSGRHTIRWEAVDASGVPLGKATYFAQISTPTLMRTVKLIQTEQ